MGKRLPSPDELRGAVVALRSQNRDLRQALRDARWDARSWKTRALNYEHYFQRHGVAVPGYEPREGGREEEDRRV